MRRYRPIARRPRAWEAGGDLPPGSTITIHEDAPQPTGLLDVRGNELFAVNDLDPIGFVRFGLNLQAPDQTR